MAADAYPTSSAPLINSYLAANGIIMGKAALNELQDGGNSVNPTTQYKYGLITTMLNAYNQTRIAGGSFHISKPWSHKFDHKEAWLDPPQVFLVDIHQHHVVLCKAEVSSINILPDSVVLHELCL